ncbi:MAG: type II and III secretion system protein, partial [Fervidobacterium sp.]|nr:type II and III secretion system protein [Fervidobacterium sp.]
PIKIASNIKKEDIERLSKILGLNITLEQISEVLYIRGDKTEVEKINEEIAKLQIAPERTYAYIEYNPELDQVIKKLYNVETYRTKQGFVVYGTQEEIKKVRSFVEGMKPEQTYVFLNYPQEIDEIVRELYNVRTYKTQQGYFVIGTKEVIKNVTEFINGIVGDGSGTVATVNTVLEARDIETIISIFDTKVRYFKIGQKVYLVGPQKSVERIEKEIKAFKPESEYNLIDNKLLIEVKDKSIKQLLLEVAKLLSEEIIIIDEIKSQCSMRIIVSNLNQLLESLKAYNIVYEKKGSVYYISESVPSRGISEPAKSEEKEEITVKDGLITINVSNKNVGDIISQVMLKLKKSYNLDKIEVTLNSVYLKDIDYETFKQVFSKWVEFYEVGGITYISPKNAKTAEAKKVFVKDGLISINISNENLSEVIKTVFQELGYHVVFSKQFEKNATMSVSNIDFETFNSIMFNYGISIKKLGNVYIVDTTPEATKVRTTYTFNVPRNADKVEELIKFYGGKAMVSPAAGLIVAYDLDPKNVDDINRLISEFTTAKIVSIEAKILDESQSSGLSTELVTLLKSGNYLTFGSEGLKLNINIIDILDGTILDKILNEAQISFQTKSAEGLAPKGNSGSGKLLANPNIMTKSGEEARIFIGDNVPVKIASGSGEQRSVEIRNLEGGIELKITPYVNSDNTIDLELTTSVNNFDYSVVIDGLPKLNKREAKTKITIKNGQTIVIGGLAREEKSKSEWKIPILGDLPIIGMLFRGMKETVEQRNITIFLTAKVIELK